MTKVDLSKPNVPNQAPKWLGEYGKRLYPKLATYLNKNDKILRADEYLLQQYCSAYDVYRDRKIVCVRMNISLILFP